MRLGRAARKQLGALIAGATSLKGDFFRSVAFRYFHPDDVISGDGTRLHSGRFVPVGVRAVYASLDEETALREVTSRKTSQELAAIWISEGIDSVVFPSVTGAGRNVAVYLANAAAGSVVVRNRAEVLAALRRPRAGKRDR